MNIEALRVAYLRGWLKGSKVEEMYQQGKIDEVERDYILNG